MALAREVIVVAGEQTFPVEVANAGLRVDPDRDAGQGRQAQQEPGGAHPGAVRWRRQARPGDRGRREEAQGDRREDRQEGEPPDGRGPDHLHRGCREGPHGADRAHSRRRRDHQGRCAWRWSPRRSASRSRSREKTPKVGKAAVDEAMNTFARPATAGPDRHQPRRYAGHAAPGRLRRAPLPDRRPPDGTLTPAVNVDDILKELTTEHPNQVTPPIDASYQFKDGKPALVPGQVGGGHRAGHLRRAVQPRITCARRSVDDRRRDPRRARAHHRGRGEPRDRREDLHVQDRVPDRRLPGDQHRARSQADQRVTGAARGDLEHEQTGR